MLLILTLTGCATTTFDEPPGLVCYEKSYKITCVMLEAVPTVEVPDAY